MHAHSIVVLLSQLTEECVTCKALLSFVKAELPNEVVCVCVCVFVCVCVCVKEMREGGREGEREGEGERGRERVQHVNEL